jgi:predicted GIY-YIG superfamily endonuclease
MAAQAARDCRFHCEVRVDRLLYFESFDDVRTALNREKQLKGWTRQKKIALIEARNPSWIDLSQESYEGDRGPSTPLRSAQDDIE